MQARRNECRFGGRKSGRDDGMNEMGLGGRGEEQEVTEGTKDGGRRTEWVRKSGRDDGMDGTDGLGGRSEEQEVTEGTKDGGRRT